MSKIVLLFLLFLIVFSISFASSTMNVGDDEFFEGINIIPPIPPINYSLIPTVNSSDWWNGYNVPTDIPNSEYWINDTSIVFDLHNDTWDNSFLNIWNYNQTLATFNTWGKLWANHTSIVYNLWDSRWYNIDTSAYVNCSTSEAFLGNGSCIDTDLFFDNTDTTIGNCSVDNSCPLITYDNELSYTVDTSAHINCSTSEVFLGNGSCMDSDVFFDDTDTDTFYNWTDGAGATDDLNTTGTGIFGGLAVDNDTLFVDAVNNRIGFRTNTPLYAIDLRGGNIMLENTYGYGMRDTLGQGVYILKGGADDYTWIIPIRTARGVKIMNFAEDTALMTILDSGNVGIGAIPTKKLEVNGDMKLSAGASRTIYGPASYDLQMSSNRNLNFFANDFTPMRLMKGQAPFGAGDIVGQCLNIRAKDDAELAFFADVSAGNWRARGTQSNANPVIIRAFGGELIFYIDLDKPDLSTFTPTEVFRMNSTGAYAIGEFTAGKIINPAIYCESSELVDQTFAVAGARYRLNISNIDEGNGISMETGNNGTNISIDVSGVYHLVAQPQVKAGAGGAGDFHMWLEKFSSGTWADIPDSNIELKLSSLEEDVIVLATTLKLNQGEKLRLVASVSDNKILLHAQSPAGEPIIPSIIFTMYRIGS